MVITYVHPKNIIDQILIEIYLEKVHVDEIYTIVRHNSQSLRIGPKEQFDFSALMLAFIADDL